MAGRTPSLHNYRGSCGRPAQTEAQVKVRRSSEFFSLLPRVTSENTLTSNPVGPAMMRYKNKTFVHFTRGVMPDGEREGGVGLPLTRSASVTGVRKIGSEGSSSIGRSTPVGRFSPEEGFSMGGRRVSPALSVQSLSRYQANSSPSSSPTPVSARSSANMLTARRSPTSSPLTVVEEKNAEKKGANVPRPASPPALSDFIGHWSNHKEEVGGLPQEIKATCSGPVGLVGEKEREDPTVEKGPKDESVWRPIPTKVVIKPEELIRPMPKHAKLSRKRAESIDLSGWEDGATADDRLFGDFVNREAKQEKDTGDNTAEADMVFNALVSGPGITPVELTPVCLVSVRRVTKNRGDRYLCELVRDVGVTEKLKHFWGVWRTMVDFAEFSDTSSKEKSVVTAPRSDAVSVFRYILDGLVGDAEPEDLDGVVEELAGPSDDSGNLLQSDIFLTLLMIAKLWSNDHTAAAYMARLEALTDRLTGYLTHFDEAKESGGNARPGSSGSGVTDTTPVQWRSHSSLVDLLDEPRRRVLSSEDDNESASSAASAASQDVYAPLREGAVNALRPLERSPTVIQIPKPRSTKVKRSESNACVDELLDRRMVMLRPERRSSLFIGGQAKEEKRERRESKGSLNSGSPKLAPMQFPPIDDTQLREGNLVPHMTTPNMRNGDQPAMSTVPMGDRDCPRYIHCSGFTVSKRSRPRVSSRNIICDGDMNNMAVGVGIGPR